MTLTLYLSRPKTGTRRNSQAADLPRALSYALEHDEASPQGQLQSVCWLDRVQIRRGAQSADEVSRGIFIIPCWLKDPRLFHTAHGFVEL